jgi:hypothetical protein
MLASAFGLGAASWHPQEPSNEGGKFSASSVDLEEAVTHDRGDPVRSSVIRKTGQSGIE